MRPTPADAGDLGSDKWPRVSRLTRTRTSWSHTKTRALARRLQTDVTLDPLDAHPKLVEVTIASRVGAREQLETALGCDAHRFDLYLEVIDVTAKPLESLIQTPVISHVGVR